ARAATGGRGWPHHRAAQGRRAVDHPCGAEHQADARPCGRYRHHQYRPCCVSRSRRSDQARRCRCFPTSGRVLIDKAAYLRQSGEFDHAMDQPIQDSRLRGNERREARPRSTTVDIHSHVAIPEAIAFVKPHLDVSTVPLAHFADAQTKALSQKQEEDVRARITGYDERLADLDGMGIDLQLVMPPPNQCYYTVPLDIAVKAAHIVNDGLAEYVARKSDRFIALGTVPLVDGAEAARELERCMTSLGMKGAEILTNVAGRELSEPEYAPFWQKAEALGALVVIHPNGFTDARRLQRFYFNNVIGNPLETTIALHYLIFDGVLERHPDLKILAVHGGGYLPAYSGRIDHAWGARSDAH